MFNNGMRNANDNVISRCVFSVLAVLHGIYDGSRVMLDETVELM